jgi:alpha/beta superfamily hydrolase
VVCGRYLKTLTLPTGIVTPPEQVLVPGGRDVRASLDAGSAAVGTDAERADTDGGDDGRTDAGNVGDAGDATDDGADAGRLVVACPPHPQMGGSRSDSRLVAASDVLGERGIDCLRVDYGDWDEGRGEQRDVGNALAWAGERYDAVGLFGFSFGATMALCVAAGRDDISGVSAHAPDRGREGADAVVALSGIECPVQVLHGARDDTADWEPIAERVRELGHTVEALPADHFFVGQQQKVAERVGTFFERAFG